MISALLRILACAVAMGPALAAAQVVVSILDGEARIVHARGSFAAVEGLKLPPASIVNLDAKAGLLRLEWPDGSAADLGPGTHAMVLPDKLSEKTGKAPGLYVLRGFVKVSGRAPATAPVVLAPGLEIAPAAGVVVVQATPERSAVFAESGAAMLGDRLGKAAPQSLPAGQFWSRAGGAAATVQPRPPGDWLAQIPRAFRDTLPLRRNVVLARNVTGKPLPLPGYADLRDWLYTEPLVRRVLVTQFTAWAQEPSIKSALITNINDHREWGPIVLPPPPLPKSEPPRPGPASGQRATP